MSASDDGAAAKPPLPKIRIATGDDLKPVMAAMAALAIDLKDPFMATPDMMDDALFGPRAHSVCLLAGPGVPPLGAVLCSPFLSTVLGHPCVYVSDLWVAKEARGRALGRGLLAAAAVEGRRRWQARALYLNVYSESTEAMDFYRHIGFRISTTDNRAALSGAGFDALLAAGAAA